jgi:hypothetical protein
MKHLLNNLSSDEKNSIREQYEGGMSIDTSKFKKLLETKLGDAKPLINEQETVGDLERKQFTDMMQQEYLDKKWKEEMESCLNGAHGKSKGKDWCLNQVYHENMESIDNELSKLGFPNGFNVPENISIQDFNELKIKWSQSMI